MPATILAFAAPAHAAASLASERAQAAIVGAQVTKLDGQLSDLQERYNDSADRLEHTDRKVAQVDAQLKVEQANLTVAIGQLRNRVLNIYESGAGVDSQLLQLTKAQSVSNFVNSVDAINRVSHADAQIVDQVRTLREQVETTSGQLRTAQSQQRTALASVGKQRAQFARKVKARTAVLDSVNNTIRTLVAKQEAAQAAAAAAASRARAAQLILQNPQSAPVDPTVTATPDVPSLPSVPAAVPGVASPVSIQPAPSTTSTTSSASATAATTPTAPAAPAYTPAPATVPSSGVGAAAAGVAEGYIGTPYVYGGESPAGFDCSGLVAYAFAKVGRSLPHSSYAQYSAGPHISEDQLQVGDLVFFDGLGHVGIYVGGGSFVHAPHTGANVEISSISSLSYVGAVRVQ